MNIEKTIIKPGSGWELINISEIIRYKDLFYFYTIRGIKAKYAQSVLGVGWAIIQPLFTTLLFTLVFGKIAKIDSNGIPYLLFSLSGVVPWAFFSGSLTESSNSLIANANMISKVYFPRLILPMSATLGKLLDFIIGCFLLVGFSVYFGYYPNSNIIFLPLLVLIMFMAASGTGMILSSMAVQYRDVKHAMSFLVQLLMFTAPVVYPASKIPEKYQTIYALNPMGGIIEGFRAIFIGVNPMPWNSILIGSMVAIFLFVFGMFYFRRMEKIFADVV
jgi:lipopolysaccharide transport system permease protein